MNPPPMLEELVDLVTTTLPDIKISVSSALNGTTKNVFPAVTFEPKKPSGPAHDLCTGLTVGLDAESVIFAIHCTGKEDQVRSKPAEDVTVEELLHLLHRAFATPN